MIRRSCLLIIFLAFTALGLAPASGAEPVYYQLYQNPERYGVVVFPRERNFPELVDLLASLGFKEVDSGEAVMRFGEKRENMTYMMPKPVQEKHGMQKFLTIQVLGGKDALMVGIYEQEYGLTLPPKTFNLDEVKENIPKTLALFREQEGKKKINLDAGDRLRLPQSASMM